MEVRVWQVHDHKRHTVAYRVVSDVYTVTRLRVLDARLHGGTHFTSGRYGGLVSGGKGKTVKRERCGTRSSVYRNPRNRALCRTIWTIVDGHLRRSSLWLDLSPGNRDWDCSHRLLCVVFPVVR